LEYLESAKSKSFWGGLGFTSKNQNVSVPQEFSVGGWSKNRTEFPEHKSPKQAHKNHEETGDKESPKACNLLKCCEPLYTCPQTLFYREMKGLLHSEITPESWEYS
jgi:hypothetical protein